MISRLPESKRPRVLPHRATSAPQMSDTRDTGIGWTLVRWPLATGPIKFWCGGVAGQPLFTPFPLSIHLTVKPPQPFCTFSEQPLSPFFLHILQ
jgi:hypothetical protein